jgi:hypothetical protein
MVMEAVDEALVLPVSPLNLPLLFRTEEVWIHTLTYRCIDTHAWIHMWWIRTLSI